MLTLGQEGKFSEEDLAEAAKKYLPLYGRHEKDECKVPWKYESEDEVHYVVFCWMAGQWIFVDIKA